MIYIITLLFLSDYAPQLLRLSCDQCILQWTYTAGNNWGNCPNGTGAVGCGPQVPREVGEAPEPFAMTYILFFNYSLILIFQKL